jgi:hypothetical protein
LGVRERSCKRGLYPLSKFLPLSKQTDKGLSSKPRLERGIKGVRQKIPCPFLKVVFGAP